MLTSILLGEVLSPGRVVIGTAGHVDHGKTALVKALTGQDTDRLPAEKARGISIDLGFASLDMPSGRVASIVDVPGHERFIKNMLAGASGIDLVLLVVAADDGIMPQTREHLDILSFLEIRGGVVALTKTDLVDEDWAALQEEEIRETLRGTFLENGPIIRVSAVKGEGIFQLLAALDAQAEGIRREESRTFPRLPIDRVFTVPGFGTVVTGTLVSGQIRVEDRMEILPTGIGVRVRGLQSHGSKVEVANAGSRTAVNLTGVEVDQVRRGDLLTVPGRMVPSRIFAGTLRLLPGAAPVSNGTRVHLHTGTAEVTGRVILLDRDELAPGEEAFIRFRAQKPLVVEGGDRFVIRSYSPMTTIGGGRVLDPRTRHKRGRAEDLTELSRMEKATPSQLILLALGNSGPMAHKTIALKTGLADVSLAAELKVLAGAGKLNYLTEDWLISPEALAAAGEGIRAFLVAYHAKEPLRSGVKKEEVKSRLFSGLDGKAWQALAARLEGGGYLVERGGRLSLPGHIVRPEGEGGKALAEMERRFREGGTSPPSQEGALSGLPVGPKEAHDLLELLLEEGRLLRLSEEIIWHREALEAAQAKLGEALRDGAEMTPGQIRDLLGTSRRHVVPLLEYLDGVGVTRRVGDKRSLAKKKE